MKYSRLTKEQFEELNQEFINFLATQSITADEWTNLKANSPETAEMELDVFSDLIWEGVLQNANYLENVSPQQLFLFQIAEDKMTLITLRVLKDGIDITNAEGYKWLQENYSTDDVEFYTASKDYSEDKNVDVFSLIEQGAVITKGALFSFFNKIINA